MSRDPSELDSAADHTVLAEIAPGMSVFDSTGEEIGTVKFVKMTDPEAATIQETPDEQTETIFENFAEAFTGDDDRITERLRKSGFVQMEGKGLFSGEKLISPNLIEGVGTNGVRLNVAKDNIPDPT